MGNGATFEFGLMCTQTFGGAHLSSGRGQTGTLGSMYADLECDSGPPASAKSAAATPAAARAAGGAAAAAKPASRPATAGASRPTSAAKPSTGTAPKGLGAAIEALGAAKATAAGKMGAETPTAAKPATAKPGAGPRLARTGAARRPSAATDGKAFLEENRGKDGVIALPSGLQYKILRNGDGERCTLAHNSASSHARKRVRIGQCHPTVSSPCTCHYQGTLIDGTKFDSSYDRGSPTTFAPNQVIKGWTEAMQLMVEGDKWEMYALRTNRFCHS
jgi:FKBP-type peptidyl-prolyl cis-trans isomerase FklB